MVRPGMLDHERRLWESGHSSVAGIDEVGRGPLAGPVVAAAVVFPPFCHIPPVDDSKKLTAERRSVLRDEIMTVPGVRWVVVEVSAQEIDQTNILLATHKAMREAVRRVGAVDLALIDGLPVPDFPVPSEAIVKGDTLSASIAAASILAKVHRDELMDAFARAYPEYGFDRHKGYGTSAHLAALRRHGPCPIHRRTFAPVATLLDAGPEQGELEL